MPSASCTDTMAVSGPTAAAAVPVMLAVRTSRAGRPGSVRPGGRPAGVIERQSWVGRPGREVGAEQDGRRRLPGADREQLRAAGLGGPGYWHRDADAGGSRDCVAGAERQRGREVDPLRAAHGEVGLVQHRLVPALVLGERDGADGYREDHQQRRAALPDRAPAELPARERDAEPAGPVGEPVEPAGQKRQDPQRDRAPPRPAPAPARPTGPGRRRGCPAPPAAPARTAGAARSRSAAIASRTTSAPARAVVASAACRPRRTLAVTGSAGLSTGHSMMRVAPIVIAAAVAQTDSGTGPAVARAGRRGPPGPPPGCRPRRRRRPV